MAHVVDIGHHASQRCVRAWREEYFPGGTPLSRGGRAKRTSPAPNAALAARRAPEQAIALADAGRPPRIDTETCLNCGQCIRICPSATIAEGWRGFGVQSAGRLGRHPRLARELPGIFNEDQVVEIVQACLDLYRTQPRRRTFAHLFQDRDFEDFSLRFCGNAV